MDLMQIKQYLRTRKSAPLRDLALHFQVEAETVRPLLETWMRKGKVRKHPGQTATCAGCCRCDLATVEIYEWRESF